MEIQVVLSGKYKKGKKKKFYYVYLRSDFGLYAIKGRFKSKKEAVQMANNIMKEIKTHNIPVKLVTE